MRSLFKLTLAAIAMFAVATASAWAQDASLKVNLNVMSATGVYNKTVETKFTDSNDSDKTTTANANYRNEFQTDFLVTGTGGPVTARGLIRFRDAANLATAANPPGDPAVSLNERGPETNRADIYWKASDLFSLGFMGRSLGIPSSSIGYGVYNSSACSAGCTIGEVVGPVGFFSNVRGLDAQFTFGGMTAGLLLLDDCAYSCGYSVTANTPTGAVAVTSGGTKDEGSFVPYFSGTFGIVSIGAYMVSASGKVPATSAAAASNNGANETVKDKDLSVSGTVTDVNGKVDLGNIQIGFEYWTAAASCDKKALATLSKCDDQTDTSTVLGLRLNAGPGQVQAHYSTRTVASAQTLTAGTSKFERTSTTNDIMLGYAIAITPNFTLNPLYASNVTNAEIKGKAASNKLTTDTTQSFIALAGRAAF